MNRIFLLVLYFFSIYSEFIDVWGFLICVVICEISVSNAAEVVIRGFALANEREIYRVPSLVLETE